MEVTGLRAVSLRKRLAFVLAAILLSLFASPASADTAGIITGVVTDDKTHKPIAGVAVTAGSPSATYKTVTDDRGHYNFLSVIPDNYTVSFTAAKYLAYSSIVVVLNGSQQTRECRAFDEPQDDRVDARPARNGGSAFQRGMTIDTYTVTGYADSDGPGQGVQYQRERFAAQHSSVTIDKSGTVSIRGGFAFEAAYEFEGIDYTTPTREPAEHAAKRRQLQPAQRRRQRSARSPAAATPHTATREPGWCCSRPSTARSHSSSTRDVEAVMFPYLHQLGLEWGWADPSQRLSNYAGFIGHPQCVPVRHSGTAANTLGTLGTNAATLGSTIDPEPGLLRAAVSFVQRLRRQPDLPVRDRTTSSGSSSSSRISRSRRRSTTADFSICRTSRAARRRASARRIR